MNRRFAVIISLAVFLLAAGVAALFLYRSNGIHRGIRTIVKAVETVDNIDYGRISYNPATDVVTVSDILITFHGDRGTVAIDNASFTDTKFLDLHDAYLYGITYKTANKYSGVMTINELTLKKFSPESFIRFLTNTKGAADYTFFPTWLSSPFDMESCEVSGLRYSQPTLTIDMEHFIWTGPLKAGQTPGNLHVDISNAIFHISDNSSIELSRNTYIMKSLTYIREYDKSTGIYKENYKDIVFENLFTLNASHELHNFDADMIVQAVRDGYSAPDVILSTTEIKKSEFSYEDHSFVNALMVSAQNLAGFDVKLFMKKWLQSDLPVVLSDIDEKRALSDAALVFLDNPKSLVLVINPAEPVPFRDMNDPAQFNLLNMVLKVNELTPIEIHMK